MATLRLEREPERIEETAGLVAGLVADHPLLRDFPHSEQPPTPASVRELDQRTALIKFRVSESEGNWGVREPHITLHDVVCLRCGLGIGTEAVGELCRYADRRALPIVAVFAADHDGNSSVCAVVLPIRV